MVHEFDVPERFVAGTVGVPGERTFFLQAVDGPLLELLDEVRRRAAASAGLLLAGGQQEDVRPLATPVEEEFRVATMALAWDGSDGLVVVEATAQASGDGPVPPPLSDEPEGLDGPDVLRVRLRPAQVRSFVRRAQRVVAAGRKPCYLCGLPLDPDGHRCPRLN